MSYDPSSPSLFPDSYVEEPATSHPWAPIIPASARQVTEAEYQRWIQEGLAKAKARKEKKP